MYGKKKNDDVDDDGSWVMKGMLITVMIMMIMMMMMMKLMTGSIGTRIIMMLGQGEWSFNEDEDEDDEDDDDDDNDVTNQQCDDGLLMRTGEKEVWCWHVRIMNYKWCCLRIW